MSTASLLTVSRSTTPPPPTAVNRMTHRCQNITLPQTLFAGGKNVNFVLDGLNKWQIQDITFKKLGTKPQWTLGLDGC